MDNFIGEINSYMNYAVAKRNVVSNNIVNANTPNYKAQDVSFVEQLEGNGATGTLRLRPVNNGADVFQTQPNHLPAPNVTNAPFKVTTKVGNTNQDGNGVDVTLEMIELMKVNQLYAVAVHALNKQSSINSAARGK